MEDVDFRDKNTQQAETAKKAQGIASVVRDAKARLMAADIVELLNGLDETSQSEADRKAERNILQQQLDANNQRLGELERLQMSSEVEQARSLAFNLESLTEKFRSLMTIANQRITLLDYQNKTKAALINPAAIATEADVAELSRAAGSKFEAKSLEISRTGAELL